MAEITQETPNTVDTAVDKAPAHVTEADEVVDPDAPSREVSSMRQRLSNIFTIFAAGAALISDGYQNNLM